MLQRREFMKVFSAAGLGGTLLPGVLWAQSQGKRRNIPGSPRRTGGSPVRVEAGQASRLSYGRPL